MGRGRDAPVVLGAGVQGGPQGQGFLGGPAAKRTRLGPRWRRGRVMRLSWVVASTRRSSRPQSWRVASGTRRARTSTSWAPPTRLDGEVVPGGEGAGRPARRPGSRCSRRRGTCSSVDLVAGAALAGQVDPGRGDHVGGVDLDDEVGLATPGGRAQRRPRAAILIPVHQAGELVPAALDIGGREIRSDVPAAVAADGRRIVGVVGVVALGGDAGVLGARAGGVPGAGVGVAGVQVQAVAPAAADVGEGLLHGDARDVRVGAVAQGAHERHRIVRGLAVAAGVAQVGRLVGVGRVGHALVGGVVEVEVAGFGGIVSPEVGQGAAAGGGDVIAGSDGAVVVADVDDHGRVEHVPGGAGVPGHLGHGVVGELDVAVAPVAAHGVDEGREVGGDVAAVGVGVAGVELHGVPDRRPVLAGGAGLQVAAHHPAPQGDGLVFGVVQALVAVATKSSMDT